MSLISLFDSHKGTETVLFYGISKAKAELTQAEEMKQDSLGLFENM